MNFEEIWGFIKENSSFFRKISKKEEINIDFDNMLYFIEDEWRADPFYMIISVFRSRFSELGPSNEHEFTRMVKMSHNHGVKLPFGKKEYDEYMEFDTKNQTILYSIEEFLDAKDYKFTIPSKEDANIKFRNVASIIEQVLSDIFIYEGREARYYVDIYDRLAGFEVFLDNGSIFVPARYFNIPRCSLYEDKLRKIDISSKITVLGMENVHASDNISGEVFVSSEYTDGIANVCKYFRSFNIVANEYKFAIEMVKSIKTFSKEGALILVNDTSLHEYYIDIFLSMYSSNGVSSVPYLIDVAKSMSMFTPVEKDMFLTGISSDIPIDIIDMVKPYIDGGDDDHETKIYKLIDDGNIELCARNVKISGDSSSIIFYNKRMKYFKEFTIDRSGIVNEFIPDIGGFRYISTYCGIGRDKAPKGYSSVDSYITAVVTRVIHREFSTLPVYTGSRSSGVHLIDGVPVMAYGDSVFGLNGKHSIGGVIIEGSSTNVIVPKTKPTKRQVVSYLSDIVESSKGFIVSENNEYEYFALMMASSIVLPFVSKANKFTATIVGANNYIRDGIIYRIFNGIFSNSRVVSTDSDYVIKSIADGSSSILVTDLKRETKNTIESIAKERFGSEHLSRVRAYDPIKVTINISPIVVFSDSDWIIDDSVVFNFRPRVSNVSDSRLYEYGDVSGSIASYVFSNIKKIAQIEEKFISKARMIIKSDKIVDKNSYMDFFEKILPAMVLCELTGYKSGMDFHDDMMSIFFRTSRIRKSLKVDKLILGIRDGGNKVEDKIFDESLRMHQHGDLIYVDKAFHRSYIDSENTDMYVFVFDSTSVYERLRKDLDISYVEFIEILREYDGYVNHDNGSKNWRIGSNKKMSVYGAYREYIGDNKDNYCAIRMSKSGILNI
jgi:hypothetical protein